MSLDVWVSFVLLAFVAVMTPGPAILLAVTNGGKYGIKGAVFPALGNITGLAVLVSLTSVGVGTVMETSAHWFFWLRIVGGLYLIYLGIKLLRSPRSALAGASGETAALVGAPGRRKSYLQGLGVALSNPKAILFIGALFPQFIDTTHPATGQLAIMGLTMMTLSFTILLMYAALSGTLLAKGRQTLFGKINKISGALFVAFGAALAAGSR